MQHTDHHLIVGRDAQNFARQLGFAVESDLNTDNSRSKWLEWKRRVDPEHYLDPATRAQASLEQRFRWCATAWWTPSTSTAPSTATA